jgi:hypothetical protein
MALSPNYGWAEPDNSSLVKNGAADIRTLGDAIDTSVWNVGYGQAGKNKLINGDFGINQRAFTTTTTSGTFGFDRWLMSASNGTSTYSAQTFTAGAAPVAGYEGINFARMDSTGQTLTSALTFLQQRIEDVRSFANQTITVSFWAKAASGTPKVSIETDQQFGSGGSTRVTTYGGQVTLSTSWARYSVSFAVPSVSGKTIGTGSYLGLYLWTSAGSDFNSRTGSLGIQTATIDFWGVQIEYGSKVTPFQTASGDSPQAELAMCQRYYYAGTANIWSGNTTSGSLYYVSATYPVTMRGAVTVTPTGSSAFGFSNTARAVLASYLNTVSIQATATSTVSGGYFDFTYTANAEL